MRRQGVGRDGCLAVAEMFVSAASAGCGSVSLCMLEDWHHESSMYLRVFVENQMISGQLSHWSPSFHPFAFGMEGPGWM